MRLAPFFFLAIALSGAPLHAQNLVLNGEFDDSLVGWGNSSDTDMLSTWSAVDANGSPDSGSALIINISPGPSNGVTLSQCIPVNTGQRYTYGGKARIPSGTGQVLTNNAVVSLRWYSGPDCTTPNGGAITTGGSPQSFNTWVDQTAGNVLARAGARSAEIRALVSKTPAGGSFSAQFDDIYVTSRSIFANGFD